MKFSVDWAMNKKDKEKPEKPAPGKFMFEI
jgi:hypothetical protein